MAFTERVHAFIAARFHARLTEQFGERGRKAFIHATQYYAEQRGRRMAQRAIRDGMELNYGTYMQYGEWVNSPEIIAEGITNLSKTVSVCPDYAFEIHRCPWHIQFKEMGLTDAGQDYCEHLDNSICRGFNPYITYLVPQTLHNSEYCIHCIKNADIEEGKTYSKKEEYIKPFEYHCAHSYWSYAEVTEAIFSEEGRKLNAAVLDDFTAEYGTEMADRIMEYKNVNFNVCD